MAATSTRTRPAPPTAPGANGAARAAAVKAAARKARMAWTGDAEADRLVSEDPLALLIGFCLDQQVPVEWAFMGPLRVRERLGTLDAAKLSRIDPGRFETAFRTPPALHRYPGAMAQRVQALCRVVASEYRGDASRIWREAKDAQELYTRFAALPGFGAMKARIMVGVVAKQLRVKSKGWQAIAPDWPTLADVHTVKEREAYQAQKRAHKAALREQAKAAKQEARG